MKRKIIITDDGSTTIQIADWNEQYHSKHGAIQEAYHVFIKQGLFALEQSEISILEMGFGTGLNTLITFWEAQKKGFTITYNAIEAFPVVQQELEQLNFVAELGEEELNQIFNKIHSVGWEECFELTSFFTLHKQKKIFDEVEEKEAFHLIYFDAFGPRVQPELWTVAMFKKMFNALQTNGILVTYSAKGSVRRGLQDAGFIVERLPGPPGKREMLRAKKI